MSAITIQIIDVTDPAYQQVWQVREEVLRKPLGMSLKNEDLSMDAEDVIFAAMADDKVVGCVMLHPVTPGVMNCGRWLFTMSGRAKALAGYWYRPPKNLQRTMAMKK